ncbi:MAG: hypothetical protein IJW34_04365 [Clostridia bacterium]|nr:hypothetical protein [Clostridia bacterium]
MKRCAVYGLAPTWLRTAVPKTALAVFNVGEMILRMHQKLCADLVILFVILSKPRMRRVEVLRRRKGVYAVRSKTKGCLHPEGISFEFDLPLPRQTYILCDETVL